MIARGNRSGGGAPAADDLEGGGEGSYYASKSSGSNSPGTASKEDRRGRGIMYLQHAVNDGLGTGGGGSGNGSGGGSGSSSSGGGGGGSGDEASPKGFLSGSGLPNVILVPALVLVWYTFAVAAITTSKMMMNMAPLPYLLCTSQFLSALGAMRLLHSLGDDASGSPRQPHVAPSLLPKFNTLLTQVALSYTFGFIFTNMAFSVVTASFAETVKSAEPISSVVLGYYLLGELASTSTYATLVPICAGVALSCAHDDSFDLWGFGYAALSNVCFSGRAVLAKRLLRQFPGSIDEVGMFHRISAVGLLVLVPLTVVMEGGAIYRTLWLRPDLLQGSLLELASLAFINGCAYACYNLTSFLVLARTNLVTHAVLNCFRRVFIIVFTSAFFAQPISAFNLAGVALAVLGVLLFAYFRRVVDAKPDKAVE